MVQKSELGTCVQQEDNGTFTAAAVMLNFNDEEAAQAMSVVMVDAIHDYLNQSGVNPIIDKVDIN